MKIQLVIFNLAALIVGGLVGAGVALLYAPQSGRATRAMLHTKGIVLQERVSDEVKLTRAQVQDRLGTLANGAQTVTGGIGDRIDKIKETVGSISIPSLSNGH